MSASGLISADLAQYKSTLQYNSNNSRYTINDINVTIAIVKVLKYMRFVLHMYAIKDCHKFYQSNMGGSNLS